MKLMAPTALLELSALRICCIKTQEKAVTKENSCGFYFVTAFSSVFLFQHAKLINKASAKFAEQGRQCPSLGRAVGLKVRIRWMNK